MNNHALQSMAKRDGELIRALIGEGRPPIPFKRSVFPDLNKLGKLRVINNDQYIISIHTLHNLHSEPP